jgi:DNA-binding SARP family transcriptional activator
MIDISLFGVARVTDLGRQATVTDFQGVKPRQILYLLALNEGRPLPKERLADLLWNGQPPSSWCSTLEGYVSLLRHALQPGISVRDSVVQTRSGSYLLNPDSVHIDVARFDELIRRAASEPPKRALESLRGAMDLVRGEILDGERCLSWVADARLRWAHRTQRTAVEAGQLSLLVGDPASAVRFGKHACELDPLAEDGWALVIEGLWLTDRRTDALRSYYTLRALLDRELGVRPRQALERLHRAMLEDDELSLPA